MELMTDFPKLYCPYIRKIYAVNKDDFKKYGNELQLRKPHVYLVTNEVNPGYEWVFDDENTIAVEKLNGTNVKIKTENGLLMAIQNRKNPINILQIVNNSSAITQGVIMAANKEFVMPNGEYAGEVIGPKLQGNPYRLEYHLWYPFDKSIVSLRCNSWGKHPKDFQTIADWFEKDLRSIFYIKQTKCVPHEAPFAEGVVFYNLKRKAEGKSYMAKLRRDMFPSYYYAKIEVLGYPNNPIQE